MTKLWLKTAGGMIPIGGPTTAVNGAFTIGGNETTAELILNVDSADPTDDAEVVYQNAGVTRWRTRYDTSFDTFWIDRYDNAGVFQDSPIGIDGATGNVTMPGQLIVDAPAAARLILNSKTTGDARINLQDDGVDRFILRYDSSENELELEWYDAAGAYQGDVLSVDGVTGVMTLANETVGTRFHGTSGGGTSLTSVTTGLQAGLTAGSNVIIGSNAIQARNNGAASNLYLNFDGGITIVRGSLLNETSTGFTTQDSTSGRYVSVVGVASNIPQIWASSGSFGSGGDAFLRYRAYNHAFYINGGALGMLIDNDGDVSIAGDNFSLYVEDSLNTGTSQSAGVFRKWFAGDTAHDNWDKATLRIDSAAGGADATNRYNGISFWNQRSSQTCILRMDRASGDDRLQMRNGANSGYSAGIQTIVIATSTIEEKNTVETFWDERLDEIMDGVRLTRYRMNVGPMSVRASDKFKDIDRRWQERGHSPLQVEPQHTSMEPHDCALDPCDGTDLVNDPCLTMQADTYRLGVIAEEIGTLVPEIIVDIGEEDGLGKSYDLQQLATLALGSAARNKRKADALAAQVAVLESKVTQLLNS